MYHLDVLFEVQGVGGGARGCDDPTRMIRKDRTKSKRRERAREREEELQ